MPARVADSVGEMGQSTSTSCRAGPGVGKNTLFALTQVTPKEFLMCQRKVSTCGFSHKSAYHFDLKDKQIATL